MPKIMIAQFEARRALGPRRRPSWRAPSSRRSAPSGMNAMIDRPIGTPMVTRDGVSIASRSSCTTRFENMGAQVVREVSMQTNEVAGDGTTTAIVLANALDPGRHRGQRARRQIRSTCCRGIDLAVEQVVERAASASADGRPRATASSLRSPIIAATDAQLGGAGGRGPCAGRQARASSPADFSVTTETTLGRGRGHVVRARLHLPPHGDRPGEMEVVLDQPLILLTDLKIKEPEALDAARASPTKPAGRC